MKVLVFLLLCFAMLLAKLPEDLPGDELSNKEYLERVIEEKEQKKKPQERHMRHLQREMSWKELVFVSKSWEAPSLEDQIAQDTTPINLGMGAVFIPAMSNRDAIEPEVTILRKDGENDMVKSGPTGQKYNLLPGEYTVWIGNNPKFSIYKDFTIEEGVLTPIIPDWCALKIEVINNNSKPIRGEYDLARMNPLTPIGRGRGRDINLAEELRVWLLPEGTYKIIGPGTGLNALSNFLTVRIRRGEFLSYTVVQDEESNTILGGGLIDEAGQLLANKNWFHNINLGGSVDLNLINNMKKDSTSRDFGISLLLYDKLDYKKNKVDISNLMKVDLTLEFTDSSNNDDDGFSMKSTNDELRLNSIFTYKLLPRFGPYGRGEYISGILPNDVQTKVSDDESATVSHLFLIYDNLPDTIDDNTVIEVDSISNELRIQPAFSPLTLQTGFGGNLQLLKNRVINMRLLTGFGVTYERRWNEMDVKDDDDLLFDSTSSIYQNYYAEDVTYLHTSLVKVDKRRFESGPEMMLNSNMSLGRYLTMDSEFRYFAPTNRMKRPDFTVNNLLSLHLTGHVIFDWDYTYELKQPAEEELKKKESRHRFLLRFSFSK